MKKIYIVDWVIKQDKTPQEWEEIMKKYAKINKDYHDEWEKNHVEDIDECIF